MSELVAKLLHIKRWYALCRGGPLSGDAYSGRAVAEPLAGDACRRHIYPS